MEQVRPPTPPPNKAQVRTHCPLFQMPCGKGDLNLRI